MDVMLHLIQQTCKSLISELKGLSDVGSAVRVPACTQSHAHSHTYSHTHTVACTQSHVHSHMCTVTCTQSHAHSHMYTSHMYNTQVSPPARVHCFLSESMRMVQIEASTRMDQFEASMRMRQIEALHFLCNCSWLILRVGQNCINSPYMTALYMTVYLMISLPIIPYIHRTYIVHANPTHTLS